MKRLICILCILASVLACFGCSSAKKAIKNPVNFYYLTNPENYQANAITPEVRESSNYDDDLLGLMQIYVNGPLTDQHINPFPKGTAVQNITLNNVTVEIILNDSFAELNNVEMTSACACLTMTILELAGRHRLIITALNDSGETIYSTSMTKEHILLSDTD